MKGVILEFFQVFVIADEFRIHLVAFISISLSHLGSVLFDFHASDPCDINSNIQCSHSMHLVLMIKMTILTKLV